MEKTVVALFDNLDTAQTAVQELLNSGFSRDDISVVRTNQQGDHTTGNMAERTEDDASGAAAGAGIGAVLGGLAGLLVGLGALAIPGIGPIIAAGPLATALAGAGLGAATGGLVGALADAGIPEPEAGAYAEGVRRGGTLLTVRTGEDQVDRATDILNRFTPVDVNQRAGEWQSSGWSGPDAGVGPYSTSTGAPHTPQAQDMPEGRYQAGMGMADAAAAQGGEGQGPSDRESDYRTSPGMTGENSGGTYEGTGSAGYTGPGTIYKGGGGFTGGGPNRGFQDYDQDFRKDWESNYRNTGFGYERYQPAYQYGWQLGERFQGGNWNDFEANARTDWERSHPDDAWPDFKDAIHQGWDRNSGSARGGAGSMQPGAHQTSDAMDQHEGAHPKDARDNMERSYDRTMGDMSRGFESYDGDFRTDWEKSFRSSGYGYDRYQPAYQHGYNLANDTRLNNSDWGDVEATARRDWEQRHPNDAWDDFKEAIHFAWVRVRGGVSGATD